MHLSYHSYLSEQRGLRSIVEVGGTEARSKEDSGFLELFNCLDLQEAAGAKIGPLDPKTVQIQRV